MSEQKYLIHKSILKGKKNPHGFHLMPYEPKVKFFAGGYQYVVDIVSFRPTKDSDVLNLCTNADVKKYRPEEWEQIVVAPVGQGPNLVSRKLREVYISDILWNKICKQAEAEGIHTDDLIANWAVRLHT